MERLDQGRDRGMASDASALSGCEMLRFWTGSKAAICASTLQAKVVRSLVGIARQ